MENTEFDLEIITIFNKEFENKTITIKEDTSNYIDEMECYYPFGYSGINWKKKDNVLSLDLKNIIENKDKQIDNFFNLILKKHPVLIDEEVIIIGDGALNNGYLIKFNNFIKLSYHFLNFHKILMFGFYIQKNNQLYI
ncbi:hypothetical protein BOQ62_07110 [Chryseobacterium sp. CH21]|uniref:hypothetical protein n=1 Tax=Chryseobacterium sp. CH21 TaxID=713556 RepID=UPI00100ABDC9|nr:hypothetical protein [Chryseobacterium sp. CH21]RXM40289.1 hypothetical protein BOQ62_07110 [Chryseobacterium sp. CH21]